MTLPNQAVAGHFFYSSVSPFCCRYEAIIDLTRKLNSSFAEAEQVQQTTRGILNSLFPSWLPGAFKVGEAAAALGG
jgi:hypothetical protein